MLGLGWQIGLKRLTAFLVQSWRLQSCILAGQHGGKASMHGTDGRRRPDPSGGSKSRLRPACRGGVAQRQSKRLIIAVSVVRIHPPLPATRLAAATPILPKFVIAVSPSLVERGEGSGRASRPANRTGRGRDDHRPGPRAQPEHRRFGEAEEDEARSRAERTLGDREGARGSRRRAATSRESSRHQSCRDGQQRAASR